MVEPSTIDLSLLARKLLVGAGFRGGGFFVVRLLQVARLILFARIFVPADIGLSSLALACISVLSLLANFGFSQSVIRKQNDSSAFTNTVFTLSLIFGFSVFILTLVCSPFFSKMFSTDLDPYIRFLAILTLNVPLRFPGFLWEKELKFGHPSAALIIGESVSFLTTIGLESLYHAGVWSLLIGNVSGFLLSGLYIWIFAIYRPQIEIVVEHVRPLLSFGAPLMVHGVNGEAMSRGDNLMVGAYNGTTQLAYYNFAWQLPTLISSLTQTVDSMLFPVYAKLAQDIGATRRLFNLTNKMWAVAGSFLGFGMLIFADRIVSIVYGPRWEAVVPILRVMSVSFIIRYCTGYAYDNLVLVRGRTKYVMKWGIVNTILIFSVGQLMIVQMGSMGGAWFWVAQAAILIPLVRLPLIYQELGTFEFAGHIWQPLLSGIVASVLCSLVGVALPVHDWSKTFFMALTYSVAYFLLLLLLDGQLRKDATKISRMVLNRDDANAS